MGGSRRALEGYRRKAERLTALAESDRFTATFAVATRADRDAATPLTAWTGREFA